MENYQGKNTKLALVAKASTKSAGGLPLRRTRAASNAAKSELNRTIKFRAGRDMAVNMLREVNEDPDVWTIEHELRDGRPQTTALRQQLEVAMRNTDLLDGFLAVLTDRLGQAPLDLELIQALTVEAMLGEANHG